MLKKGKPILAVLRQSAKIVFNNLGTSAKFSGNPDVYGTTTELSHAAHSIKTRLACSRAVAFAAYPSLPVSVPVYVHAIKQCAKRPNNEPCVKEDSVGGKRHVTSAGARTTNHDARKRAASLRGAE